MFLQKAFTDNDILFFKLENVVVKSSSVHFDEQLCFIKVFVLFTQISVINLVILQARRNFLPKAKDSTMFSNDNDIRTIMRSFVGI